MVANVQRLTELTQAANAPLSEAQLQTSHTQRKFVPRPFFYDVGA